MDNPRKNMEHPLFLVPGGVSSNAREARRAASKKAPNMGLPSYSKDAKEWTFLSVMAAINSKVGHHNNDNINNDDDN
jgi:hypothetical protein